MIDTVIRNLINNAIKFTNKNGIVEINTIETKDKIIINVVDNGIGIKKEDIDKLFKIDKFFHRKGTNNEEVTGLGLILCKDFVEKNGGKLVVTIEENKGSKFNIEFDK